ncbi:MAG: DEAD/DEAH box helicase [Lachnospiraceae bacterium]|nr:DEAD/DEAH box helicase [Lachnospiraceae bacterium]
METMRFEDMQLREEILRAVSDMGFEEASPIQTQAIPLQMEGRDMIGQAQTGTGKTAAFGIPLLQKIDPDNKKSQAVILCPTRELAIQVAEEIRKLAKYLHGIKVLPIYGGQDIGTQIRSLKGGVQVIVGTPGRVMDHMRRHTLKLETVETVVLDEADEMLDMGFLEDIETILEAAPEERQTVMFSATMPEEIRRIAEQFQKEPELVRVLKKELTVPAIEQYYYMVKPKDKLEVLCRLLDMYSPKLSLVFCNTKKQVDDLVVGLQGRGYFAEGLHGDLKQNLRDRVMHGFRNGNTDILVATDVAARGIDVDDVEAVFNFDIPQDEEYYVHRIGRTGRAGRDGLAFSFVVGREIYKLKDIQRYCKTKIQERPIPSMKDVSKIKVEGLLNRMDEVIAQEDLSRFVDAIETKMESTDYSTLELAAALMKMSIGDEGEEIDETPYASFGRDRRDSGRRRKGDEDFREGRRRRDRGENSHQPEDGMVRMFLNIGRNMGIRPSDVVGAVAGESGITGKHIGHIDIYDRYTFFEIPEGTVRKVLKGMKNSKIKGKTVNVEIAN